MVVKVVFSCVARNPLETCTAELPWSRPGGNVTEEAVLEPHLGRNGGAEVILLGDAARTGYSAQVGNRGEAEPINGVPPCRHLA